jgi:DNA-directed RNA polymerase specialized sigma24 family protein
MREFVSSSDKKLLQYSGRQGNIWPGSGSERLESIRMAEKTVDLALLRGAQQGRPESLSALAELVRKDVFIYLRRVTLDGHVAEDLCQETILQMLESLPRLRMPTVKAFWGWMYKTAFSKVSHHFRAKGRARVQHPTQGDGRPLDQIASHGPGGPEALMRKELRAAVYEAMDSIAIKYRSEPSVPCVLNSRREGLGIGTTSCQPCRSLRP